MHQDAKHTRKEPEKVKTDLQAALNANSTLEAKLCDVPTVEECWYVNTKELSKKFLASKDAYLELIERCGHLLTKKEKLEKDVEVLKSNMEELTSKIN